MPRKCILMSVRPEHAEAIVEGRKEFEYRRRPPIIDRATTILICATLPTGKVIGAVTARRTVQGSLQSVWALTGKGGCISRQRFYEYFKGLNIASALELERPRQYSVPYSLHQRAPQSWQWL